MSSALVGFLHNGFSPFGMKESIPVSISVYGSQFQVILSKDITTIDPPFIWMGGGARQVKLGMSLQQLQRLLEPLVMDIAENRT